MTQLHHDWLTDGIIDFEYKKYILLAYLQDVKKRFHESHLYPFLSDLIFHYGNLKKIKEQKKLLYDQFPEFISRADFEKLQMNYEKIINDDDVMKELEDIIAYAIPQIDSTIKEGKEIYDFVEQNMDILPVGLTPLYDQEGYMFLHKDNAPDLTIYRYSVSIFENANEKFRGISTTLIGRDQLSVGRSAEKIKLDLTKQYKDLPNPASYLVVSKFEFPESATLLPVAKRLLIRYVSTTD